MGVRIGFGLAIVLAVAVSLAGLLNYLNFEKTHDELRGSAYGVLLSDSADSLEYALSLGLSLVSLEGTSERLNALTDRSPFLLGATVIDRDGNVIHGDDIETSLAERVRETLIERPPSSGVVWTRRSEEREWLGVPLRNPFDRVEGALILTVDRSPSQQIFSNVARELTAVGSLTILGFSLLAVLVTSLLLRNLSRQVEQLREALKGEQGAQSKFPPGFTPALAACRSSFMAARQILSGDQSTQASASMESSHTPDSGSSSHRLLILSVAAALLLSSVTLLSLYSARVFERELAPLMTFKAEVIAESLEARLERVAAFGVPLNQLRGLDNLFAQLASRNPDIGAFQLADAQGQRLARWESGEVVRQPLVFEARDIEVDAESVGRISVAPAPNYARQRMNEISLDILVMVIVAALVSAEILIFLVAQLIQGPLQSLRLVMHEVGRGVFTRVAGPEGRDPIGRVAKLLNARIREINQLAVSVGREAPVGWQLAAPGNERLLATERLGFIRPPFFLAIFAEALSLSFMPVHAGALAVAIPGLSPEFIVGLPISVFMLVWAISLPFAGQWSDRAGRRRALLVGLGVMAAGLASTAMAADFWTLIAARCLAAVGYAIVFITVQGYVTDHTTAADRTRGMAMFLSTFFSGALCGAAIGGILADRIGFENTFLAGGLLGCAALVFVWLFITDSSDRIAARPEPLRWRDFSVLFRNRDFVTITFLSAIPAKIALTGFLYYAGPLYLVSLGLSQSVTGRVLMLYGLAIVAFSPLASRLADRLGKRESFIVGGGLLAGVALVLGAMLDSAVGIGAAVLLLGIAHAAGVPPQLTVITQRIASRASQGGSLGKTVGIFRLTERIGNVSGPMIAGALIGLVGFQNAIGWLGGLLLVSAVALLVILLTASRRVHENSEADNA